MTSTSLTKYLLWGGHPLWLSDPTKQNWSPLGQGTSVSRGFHGNRHWGWEVPEASGGKEPVSSPPGLCSLKASPNLPSRSHSPKGQPVSASLEDHQFWEMSPTGPPLLPRDRNVSLQCELHSLQTQGLRTDFWSSELCAPSEGSSLLPVRVPMKLGYFLPVAWTSAGLLILMNASLWASNLLGSGIVAVGWTWLMVTRWLAQHYLSFGVTQTQVQALALSFLADGAEFPTS